ncbi:MAG: hypothetical protein LBM66_03275 [Bifidobacteriaceae bacterium]|nr:hypothetical protein [Bifidobacteriaceae bacterium]
MPAGGSGGPALAKTPGKGAPKALKFVLALVGGLVLGLIGTFQYNAVLTVGPWKYAPVGLIIALLATTAWGVFLRAWSGIGGVALDIVGLFVSTQLVASWAPGGDVVMPAGSTGQAVIGYVWVWGAEVLPLIVCFLPPSWFRPRLSHPKTPVASGPAPAMPPAAPGPAGAVPAVAETQAGSMARRAALAGDTRPPLASPARPAAPTPSAPLTTDQPGNTSALS